MPPFISGLQLKYQINSLYLQSQFGPNFELQIPNDNELPYVNNRFFDRFFRMISVDETIALYTALLTEEKTILVVCDHQNDLIPIVTTLLELMHPFEWSLPRIPFLVVQKVDDINNPMGEKVADVNNPMFEMINNI